MTLQTRPAIEGPARAVERVRRETTSRRRYAYVPVYLIGAVWLLAVAGWWQSGLFLYLLGLGIWALAPRLGWASEREWRAIAGGLIGGATGMLVSWPARGLHTAWVEVARALVVVGLMTPMAVAWWDSRRIRRPKVEQALPEIVELWRDHVLPKIPQLHGRFDLQSYDPSTGAVELHLTAGQAKHAARLAGDVEAAIDGMEGSVRLRPAEDKSVRILVVQHVPDPRTLRSRVEYAADAIIDGDGRLLMGHTSDKVPWAAPIRRKSGAAHITITGTTGSGKGVTMRRIAAALAACEWDFLIVIDLKGGTGVPSIGLGADIYASTKEEILLATEIRRDMRRERLRRYAELRRAMWNPAMGDPMLTLMVDEVQQINQPDKTWLKPLGQVIEDDAAQARAAGGQVVVSAQRNDGESMISPRCRSNLMGGGTSFMHKTGDMSARHLGQQDFDVDPSRIPGAAGWAFALCAIDRAMVQAPILVLMTPDRDEVEHEGFEAPYGTIEEWMVQRRRTAVFNSAVEARIAGRWVHAPAPAVDLASLTHEPSTGELSTDEVSIEHQFERGEGEGHESAGYARARDPLPSPSPPRTHRESMIEIFKGMDGEPIRRSEIIRRITTWQPDTKPESKIASVTDLLAEMRTAGLIEKVENHLDGPGFWRWTGWSE